jgi:hypothetical protein
VGLGIASLVLGILGATCLTVLTGIPALILGFVALGRVRKSGGRLTGNGMAIGGIVLGALSILVLPVLAGFLVPTLLRGRGEAYKVQCANNLKQLYAAAAAYLQRSDSLAFPFQPQGSIASLQSMVDFDPQRLRSGVFVCPEGTEARAAEKQDGSFTLSAESCSYEIFPARIKERKSNQVLIYDKAPHHTARGSRGGRMVVFADGSVDLIEEDEFQSLTRRAQGKPLTPGPR